MSQTVKLATTAAAREIDPDAALLEKVLTRVDDVVRRAAPAVQPMELRSFDELDRFATRAANTDMVPKDYKGKPDNIIIAVMMGAELGLRPMQALVNIAVINGRPSVWGDALLALCKTHPSYVSTEETITGAGDDRIATCRMIRRGEPPVIRTFSVADAKRAGLWKTEPKTMKKGRDGNYEVDSGPWYAYPERMLQMRARGFAARDCYPDKLRGLISAEEAQDIPLESAGIYLSAAPTAVAAPAEPAAPARPTFATVAAAKEWCEANSQPFTRGMFLDALQAELNAAQDADAVGAIICRADVEKANDGFTNGNRTRLAEMCSAATKRTAATVEGGAA